MMRTRKWEERNVGGKEMIWLLFLYKKKNKKKQVKHNLIITLLLKSKQPFYIQAKMNRIYRKNEHKSSLYPAT